MKLIGRLLTSILVLVAFLVGCASTQAVNGSKLSEQECLAQANAKADFHPFSFDASKAEARNRYFAECLHPKRALTPVEAACAEAAKKESGYDSDDSNTVMIEKSVGTNLATIFSPFIILYPFVHAKLAHQRSVYNDAYAKCVQAPGEDK